MSVPSSKKKRLFSSHILGGVGISISNSSPNIEIVDDPGFRKDFFDLGISSYLHRYKPNIKPNISIVVVSDPAYVDSLANCGAFVVSPTKYGTFVVSHVNCGVFVVISPTNCGASIIVSPANCSTPVKSPSIYCVSPVVSPLHDRELRLLDLESMYVASGCSDFVVAHGRYQLHIDELFDIPALVLFSQEEPLLVVEL